MGAAWILGIDEPLNRRYELSGLLPASGHAVSAAFQLWTPRADQYRQRGYDFSLGAGVAVVVYTA